jgi:hypothetical protein
MQRRSTGQACRSCWAMPRDVPVERERRPRPRETLVALARSPTASTSSQFPVANRRRHRTDAYSCTDGCPSESEFRTSSCSDAFPLTTSALQREREGQPTQHPGHGGEECRRRALVIVGRSRMTTQCVGWPTSIQGNECLSWRSSSFATGDGTRTGHPAAGDAWNARVTLQALEPSESLLARRRSHRSC